MFHPWRTLRALAHVTLHWHDGGPAGLTHFESATISLRRGMTQVERRCTLTHELEHIERGPAVSGYGDAEEWVVRERSARRLVTLPRLVDAMLWSRDEYELADELWVDVGTVRDRLMSLSDDESRELLRRMDEAEVMMP